MLNRLTSRVDGVRTRLSLVVLVSTLLACDSTHPTFTEAELGGGGSGGGGGGCAPVVNVVRPVDGPPGTVVWLEGLNLARRGDPELRIVFGGLEADLIVVISHDVEQLGVIVPDGIPDGATVPVTVEHSCGSWTLENAFTDAAEISCGAQPFSFSLTPSEGPVGTVVTVSGINLVGSDGVVAAWLGLTPVEILTVSAEEVAFVAPAGPPLGERQLLRLETCAGTLLAQGAFLYVP
ncbi:MAG: IPT/TIG domain-containing protein [Acidobacteriota bacterium]